MSSDSIVVYKDKEFKINEYGYLADEKDYNDIWVEYICLVENIEELTEFHNKVISFTRSYYSSHGKVPNIADIRYNLNTSIRDLYFFFKKGMITICLISGLPKPTECRNIISIDHHALINKK